MDPIHIDISDPAPVAAVPEAAPAPDPWRAWGEIVLCSGYPTQLALGLLIQASGISPLRPDRSLSGSFVFTLSLLDTVVLLTLIVWLLKRRGERPSAVFFGGRPAAPEVGVGFLSVPAIVTIVVVLMVVIRVTAPFLHNVPNNPLEGLLESQTGLLAFLFVVVVAGGLREELQRAFLLHRFRTDLGSAGIGLVMTSTAFGLGHTLQGWDAAIVTGVLGAMWGAMYLVRGSAVAPVVSHSLFNSGELLRAFLAK
jgi:membrane protease YdiL (CAAX protease family)